MADGFAEAVVGIAALGRGIKTGGTDALKAMDGVTATFRDYVKDGFKSNLRDSETTELAFDALIKDVIASNKGRVVSANLTPNAMTKGNLTGSIALASKGMSEITRTADLLGAELASIMAVSDTTAPGLEYTNGSWKLTNGAENNVRRALENVGVILEENKVKAHFEAIINAALEGKENASLGVKRGAQALKAEMGTAMSHAGRTAQDYADATLDKEVWKSRVKGLGLILAELAKTIATIVVAAVKVALLPLAIIYDLNNMDTSKFPPNSIANTKEMFAGTSKSIGTICSMITSSIKGFGTVVAKSGIKKAIEVRNAKHEAAKAVSMKTHEDAKVSDVKLRESLGKEAGMAKAVSTGKRIVRETARVARDKTGLVAAAAILDRKQVRADGRKQARGAVSGRG